MPQRILIIGGVAGGASCAARLRRLDEHAEIIIFERGAHVSFATCGLPYRIGGVIADDRALLVASAELFRNRFRIAVRTLHDVVAIDRQGRMIMVRDLTSGTITEERYDALVLSPGAVAIRPAIPGIDLPGVFCVRTIPDAQGVRAWIETRGARTALIVGGGFIGLEMAENLVHLGLQVTIVEKAGQVMPPLDPEVAAPVAERLEAAGVRLILDDALVGMSASDGAIAATTGAGIVVRADVVILAIGIRPETSLATSAGLRLGVSGGISVDARMQTSDPSIWAVGDAVESVDVVTGRPTLMALAGPANRQGRIAAGAIAGRAEGFRGVQGTSVCGAFGLTIASTGASEKALMRAGITGFEKVYLHPAQHASYYPGAKPIHMKVMYRISDGRILGAQAVGEEGVEKRIDVIAMAIQLGGTMRDLGEAELCYAPQFGPAKDPINMAGFIAENARSGDAPLADWTTAGATDRTLLDVRDPSETAQGIIPGATLIPLHQLRARWTELPAGRPVDVLCGAGQRAHDALRFLRQMGLDARNLSGGWRTWRQRAPRSRT